jgi:hypothetical protein
MPRSLTSRLLSIAKTPSTFAVNNLRRLRLCMPRLQGSVSAIGEDTRIGILKTILLSVRAFLPRHAAVAVENLALRRQLAVVSQSVKRPNLRPRDRMFWGRLSHLRRTTCSSGATNLLRSIPGIRASMAGNPLDVCAEKWLLCHEVRFQTVS